MVAGYGIISLAPDLVLNVLVYMSRVDAGDYDDSKPCSLLPTQANNRPQFLSQDAPKYMPALVTTAVFGGCGCLLTLILGAWMVIDNKKRDAKAGRRIKAIDIPSDLLASGPASEDYRWFY